MFDLILEWIPAIKFIAAGALVNLQYTIIAVCIGLALGILLASAKVSNLAWLRFFANAYTSIFRGTPLIIQLSIIYYVLPQITGIKLSVFAAAVISFSLNSAAYLSEIIRGGINAIDIGQFEAARALGIPKFLMMKDIILPQAVRKILPALINELVNMLKETAIISIVGEADILRRAQMVANQHYNYLIPMMTAAICYYLLVLTLSSLAKILEKRLAL